MFPLFLVSGFIGLTAHSGGGSGWGGSLGISLYPNIFSLVSVHAPAHLLQKEAKRLSTLLSLHPTH